VGEKTSVASTNGRGRRGGLADEPA